MGWKGMAIGGYIGSLFGGPLGALLGAVLGHKVEKAAFGRRRARRFASISSSDRSMIFSASVAAMLAKMAKADGVVTRAEIAHVEQAFASLGFTPHARRYAVDVFRRAKDDTHTIFEYAREFASAVESIEMREFLYEILWDVASADGRISPGELAILQRIPRALGIRPDWYGYFASRYFADANRDGSQAAQRDALADAYAVLGATASDGVEELKRKYRDLAKKNHPDALRAQGLPEEMVGKATERMTRINAAWSAIKTARGF